MVKLNRELILGRLGIGNDLARDIINSFGFWISYRRIIYRVRIITLEWSDSVSPGFDYIIYTGFIIAPDKLVAGSAINYPVHRTYCSNHLENYQNL